MTAQLDFEPQGCDPTRPCQWCERRTGRNGTRQPIAGPMWAPLPSGRAQFGGQCTHQAPDECDDCNGARADQAELRRDRRRAETTRRKAS